jgi:hypothetical protein
MNDWIYDVCFTLTPLIGSGIINFKRLIFVSQTVHATKVTSPNAVFIKNVISGRFTQSKQCNRSHQELYYTSVTINLYKEIRGCCLTSTLFVVIVVVAAAAAAVVVVVTFNCCIMPCYVTLIITKIIPFQHSFFC